MAKLEDVVAGGRALRNGNVAKQQPKEVQAATFLMIIGEDTRKTYSTFPLAPVEEK